MLLEFKDRKVTKTWVGEWRLQGAGMLDLCPKSVP